MSHFCEFDVVLFDKSTDCELNCDAMYVNKMQIAYFEEYKGDKLPGFKHLLSRIVLSTGEDFVVDCAYSDMLIRMEELD